MQPTTRLDQIQTSEREEPRKESNKRQTERQKSEQNKTKDRQRAKKRDPLSTSERLSRASWVP